jgi:hypothetical protein
MQSEPKVPLEEISQSKENNPPIEKKFPRSIFFIIGNEFCERFEEMRLFIDFAFTE